MRSNRKQNRAGREVAEDAKRAVRRAFGHVGLEVHQVRMIMAQDHEARFILGGANPQGWAYNIPALSVEFSVATNGSVTPVKVLCDASDDDPTRSAVFGTLSVKDCVCQLEELSEVLKGVWSERQELMARQKAGEQLRSFTGKFRWKWTTLDGVLRGEE